MTINNTAVLKSTNEITILKASKDQGVKIKSLCKRGICGLCKVKVLEGTVSEMNNKEIKKLGDENIKQGYRLACIATFSGSITIEL